MPARFGRRFGTGVGAAALLGLGFWFGHANHTPLAAQQPMAKAPVPLPNSVAPAAKSTSEQRVVAYINGNVPLTREEFGEYLIQRYGTDRIELFVNKRVIEHACAQRGIDATAVEVKAQIQDDCKLLGISMADFKTQVLRRYGKTMFEWEEDVIRPRIMLSKLCRDKIQVADDDLKKMFENRYGKKVRAKIIIWPKGEERVAQKLYDDIRKSDDEFNRYARQQPDGTLASREGEVEPIARHSMTGDNTIEDEAFKLQPGEVSRLIGTPVGTVVIKCIGHVEPKKDVEFDKVKPELLKEVVDKKISLEVPKLMESLKKEAAPVYVLKPARPNAADQEAEIKREIEQTGATEKK